VQNAKKLPDRQPMLQAYNNKRNFKSTSEPEGKPAAKSAAGKLAFVIQRHDATRLHYDFRLQLDGVLKSWAVPKGPSLNPTDKRLAVMVEDHPYEYRKFYGTIPEGNYGAGEVEIWDEGWYFPIDENHEVITQKEALKNLAGGELKMLLAGTHLSGEFVIVRMQKEENNWLLIKHDDEYAVHKKFDIEKIQSIKVKKLRNSKTVAKATTKKTVKATSTIRKAAARKTVAKKSAPKKTAKGKTVAKKTGAEKSSNKKETDKTEVTITEKEIGYEITGKANKDFRVQEIKPMLASTIEQAFDSEEWLFENKWDGYRCMASILGDEVQLWSRNGLSFNKKFEFIADELRKHIDHDVVLDGEVVAWVNGRSSFQALQHADEKKPELRYYIFDMLFLDGIAITHFPLTDRKFLLEKLLKDGRSKAIQYSDHIAGKGSSFFEKIKKEGLEGIMAKKADSTYAPGLRSKQWLKIKNRNDREAIIVGFTKGTGSRKHFGALILAEKKGKSYHYIGHTGTGFSDETLKELYLKMKPLEVSDSPFDNVIKVNAPVTWIKPQLVCTVYYTEATESGMLRHPVFAGLRTDKKAADVVAEPLVEIPPSSNKKNNGTVIAMPKKTLKRNLTDETDEVKEGSDKYLIVDKRKIPVTNISKIYFPEKKVTKGDVIAYYDSVADLILPHIKNRPLSLKRNPNGIHGEAFYHKNAGENAPSWIKTFDVYSESSDRNIEYIICNDKATLIYLANLGCIEMNPWLATYQKPENPTYIVIDIDPSDKNTFEQVIETAKAVKEVTDRAGLVSFCKTSGASGLHIYIPFAAKYTYDTLKPFGELIASLAHELVPDYTSLERNLKKRGSNIYIDYLQNRRGQTLASAYSLRPVEEASISTPLEWKEVKKGLHPSQFNIFNIAKRLESKGDLFKDVLTTKNDLRKAMKALQG
jgi:bifunctional non-homologous end joining protein LigD